MKNMGSRGRYYVLVCFLALSYSFFQVAIIPFYLSKGFNFLDIGWFFLIYWIANAVANLPTSTIGDLHGRHVVFSFGCLAHVLAFAGFIVGSTFWQFAIFEGVWGLGAALQSDALEAWIVEEVRAEAPREKSLEQVFYRSNIGRQLIFLAGGIAGALMAGRHLLWPWYFSVVSMTFTGILAYGLLRRREGVRITRPNTRIHFWQGLYSGLRHYSESKPLIGLLVINGLAVMGMQAPNIQWQAIFTHHFQFRLESLSWIWAMIVLSSAAGSLLGALLVHRGNQRLHCMGGLVTMAIPLLLIVFLRDKFVFAFAFAIHETGRGVFTPAFEASFNDFISSPMRSTVLSVLSTASVIFASIGSLAAGWLATRSGLDASWSLSGVLMLIACALFAAFRFLIAEKPHSALLAQTEETLHDPV